MKPQRRRIRSAMSAILSVCRGPISDEWSLQVCCNVSSVKIWAFESVPKFSISRLVFESDFPPVEDDLYSELQLSKCSDRPEPTIGWVGAKPGVNCTYSTGQTLNIPHGISISVKPSIACRTLPQWIDEKPKLPEALFHTSPYIYHMHRTCSCGVYKCLSDSGLVCDLLHIEERMSDMSVRKFLTSVDILCENDLMEACADQYILGSSPKASNASIDYWIKAGDQFPFASSSHIELRTSVQRTAAVIDEQRVSIAAGQKKRLVIKDLEPNEVYDIRRCVEIHLPASLRRDLRFNFSSTSAGRLCTEEGYRTQPNAMRLPYPSLWVMLPMFMICALR